MKDLFRNIANDPKNKYSLWEQAALEQILLEEGISGVVQVLPELSICNLISRGILPNNRTRLVMELRKYSNESYSSITNLATRSIKIYEKYNSVSDYTEANKVLDKQYDLLKYLISEFKSVDGLMIGLFDMKNKWVFKDNGMNNLATIDKETHMVNWSDFPLSVSQQRHIIETRSNLAKRIVNA